MATTIGAGLKISGEKEFRQALSQVDAALKTAASAAKLATAEYDYNGKSVDSLREKDKALSDAAEKQREKILLLEKALADSTTQYGENSKKTEIWQTRLNNAKTDLIKLEAELKDNKTAVADCSTALDKNKTAQEETTKSSTNLSGMLQTLASKFGVEMPASLSKFTDGLGKTNTSGLALIGVLAGVTTALVKCTTSTAKTADELLTLSSTTNVSTDNLQKLNYASEFLDVSTETVTSSLTKLTRSMDSAREGTGEQAEAFETLKISVTDTNGNLKDSQTVFYEIINRLGKMSNETDRDALSMTLLGKSAQDLNPLIEAGAGKLQQLGTEAENMGYVLSNNTLQRFGELDDRMQKLSKVGDSLKYSFAEALLPMLTQLFTVISSIPTPVLQMIIVLAGIVVTLVLVVKAIKEMTDTGTAIKNFFTSMNDPATRTTAIIMGVVVVLIALAAIIAVLSGKSAELQATMGKVSTTTTQLKSNVTSTQTVPAYAKGTSYHPGGVALIGEDGPELVDLPAGSAVRTSRQTRRILGSSGGDTYQYNFNVDSIETYVAIEKRLKSERQSKRMG